MKMITPVNNHILIEPVTIKGFIASAKDQYQEIGVVVAKPAHANGKEVLDIEVGDKVFFDAWLAKKYPKEGTTSEYYWLVKWENVTAVEYAE